MRLNFTALVAGFALSLPLLAGSLKIHVINVGWGESVLVEGPNGKTLLVDTGVAKKAKEVVIPYLQNKITKLDYFVLSHNHADHGGGAADVVEAFKPGQSWYNGSTINKSAGFMKEWFASYTSTGTAAPGIMNPGQVIDLGDGATATCITSNGKFMHQDAVIAKLRQNDPNYTLPVPNEPNGTSIVLLVKYKGFDYLYTSDLDGQGDMDLETPTIQSILLSDVASVKTPVKGIDVLQVGHHASKTATNGNFVDLAGPAVALVAVGPNQSHGLPNPEAIDDVLLAKGIKVLQTDEGDLSDDRISTNGHVVGHILLTTDGSNYTISNDATAIDQDTQLAKSGKQTQDESAIAGLPMTLKADGTSTPEPDTQAPTVVSSVMTQGANLNFTAVAKDNVGAVKAVFTIDGKSVGTVQAAAAKENTFNLTIDSSTLAAGNHQLVVNVADAAGNKGESAPVSFMVSGSVNFTEVESNNTLATSNTLADAVNKVIGYFPSASDTNDWFSLKLPAGKTLTVKMTGPTASAQDYDLYLYSSSQTQLAKSEANGTTEQFSYKNSTSSTKTLYLNVRRITGSSRVTPYVLGLTR